MTRNDIENQLKELIFQKFKIPCEYLSGENLDIPFTGEMFNFARAHMVYLLLEIQKSFKISIPVDLIEKNGLYTMNSTVDTIMCCLSTSGD